MERIVLKTDLSCNHCTIKTEPVLKEGKEIKDYSINLTRPDKLVTIVSENADIEEIIAGIKKPGYSVQIM